MKDGRKRFHWLTKMIRSNGFNIGIEVGSGKGKTAEYLLLKNPKLHLIEIAYYPNILTEDIRCSLKSMEQKFNARMKKFLKSDRIEIIAKSSHDACNHVADEIADFVFIDADHSYEHCLQDIQDWIPKVKIGGLISGHDYSIGGRFLGVEKAVKEYFGDGNFEVLDFDCGIWYTWKTK